MKFSCVALLVAILPLSDAFAPNIPKSFLGKSILEKKAAFTVVNMSGDDGDDWYADYDASQYQTYDDDGYGGQQSRGGRQSYGDRGGGGGGRGRRAFVYTRDTSRDNSNVDEAAVMDLINQRSEAKKVRDFDTADAIREDLMHNHAVGIDDRSNTWRTGISASGSGMKFGGGGRRGRDRNVRGGGRSRDFGPNGHDYDLSSDAGPNSSRLSEPEIHTMLAERLQAKMSRNFQVADGIQMELIEGGVFVHDGMKEWRADGVPYGSFNDGGRGPGKTAGSRSHRAQGYSKSPYSMDLEGGVEDSLIDGLVNERLKFKMTRDYEKADAIREGLRSKFNVLIDDRLQQWSAGGDFGPEQNAQRELADKFANRGYIKSNSSLDLSPEDEAYIQEKVEERLAAKKERDFRTADDIRESIFEEYDVTINDKMKLWSVGGVFEELGAGKEKKPRGVYTRRGGGDISEEDEKKIQEMLLERYHCKRDRDFDTADAIRDDLMRTFNVRVDDRSSEWRIDSNDYAQAGPSSLSEDDVEYISAKLRERFDFKRDRDYESADAIRDELGERFGIVVDDRTKEWRVEISEFSVVQEEGYDDDDNASLDAALEAVLSDTDEYDDDDVSLDAALDPVLDDTNNDEDEENINIVNVEGDSASEEELSQLTVVELKEKLRDAGLPVSGKKADLVARLLNTA